MFKDHQIPLDSVDPVALAAKYQYVEMHDKRRGGFNGGLKRILDPDDTRYNPPSFPTAVKVGEKTIQTIRAVVVLVSGQRLRRTDFIRRLDGDNRNTLVSNAEVYVLNGPPLIELPDVFQNPINGKWVVKQDTDTGRRFLGSFVLEREARMLNSMIKIG